MKRILPGLMILSLAGGCVAPPAVTPSAKAAKRPGKSPSPAIADSGTETAAPGRRIPLETEVRNIARESAAAIGTVKLIGKVKLISDKGLGIISNNSGSLIGNNGGGLISDKGLGVVSNGGNQFRVRQAGGESAVGEALLAEAAIEVLDGDGKLLVGADGRPITASTDMTGAYTLEATLPKENLVLRVRLFAGGQLFALLPRDGADERTVDLDSASSFGTGYVLERYVKKQRSVLARLPASEIANLYRDVSAARPQWEAGVPTYVPTEQVAVVERLRARVAQVDATLARIEAILVAGQKNYGDGLSATQVALGTPVAVAFGAAGELLVAEQSGARVRVVGADGRIRTLAGARALGQDAIKAELGFIGDMVRGPDGTIYLAELLQHRVRKLTPDGKLETVAGTGTAGQTGVGGPAAQANLHAPRALALGPQGELYIGEYPGYPDQPVGTGRLLKVGADGVLQQVPTAEADWQGAMLTGIAAQPDGTLYVTASEKTFLARLRPGGRWEFFSLEVHHKGKRLVADGQGGVYLGETYGRKVHRFNSSGQVSLVAGTGLRGYAGDGGPAKDARLGDIGGLQLGPDGALYIAELSNGVVRRVGTDGLITTVAGASGLQTVGDALAVAVNGPAGVTFDPAGAMVVTETAGNSIKRLVDRRIEVIAGNGSSASRTDGVPAVESGLDYPLGVAYRGPELFVCDAGNGLVRRIDSGGIIHVAAGVVEKKGSPNAVTVRSGEARSVAFARPTAITFDGAGRVIFTDAVNHVVVRLENDQVTVIAGQIADAAGKARFGDAPDGQAAEAGLLNRPIGLAMGAAGDLFIADGGNMKIKKIAPDGTMTTFAGLGLTAGAAKIFSGDVAPRPGESARQVALVGPAGLALDAAGNLYVSNLGTANIKLLGPLAPTLPLEPPTPIHPSILKIAPDGSKVMVVAGPGGVTLTDPLAEDALVLPSGLAIDPEGRLVVVDPGSNQIKLIPKAALEWR